MISIIIPVYNVKKTLIQCVDSAINQTYRDLEIILVDDGSTDGSSVMCDELLSKDNRIKVYHKTNGGLSSARNYGLERTNGNSIVFLDSDDFINKYFCENLIKTQEKYDADIVSSDIVKFSDLNKLDILLNARYEKSNIIVYSNIEALKEYFYPKGNLQIFHTVTNKLYKKHLFDNLSFVEGKLHEDLYITNQLLFRSSCVVLTGYPYYMYYRGNENSICKNYSEKNFVDQNEALLEIENRYSKQDILYDELLWFLLNQYYHLYLKSKELEKTDKVSLIKNNISIWLKSHLSECNIMSLKMKIKIYLSILFNRYE